MPLQKMTRVEVINRLLGVFRLHGFEGSSLAMIAREVGLQKASLYHLFPGGKEEMAMAVLESVSTSMVEKVLVPLGGEGSPALRLEKMIGQVRDFYGDGRLSCLFESLSLGNRENPFRKSIGDAMSAWVDALASLARENGAAAPDSRQRAERVLVNLQGALVVSRCLGDPKVFDRSLREFPAILLGQET